MAVGSGVVTTSTSPAQVQRSTIDLEIPAPVSMRIRSFSSVRRPRLSNKTCFCRCPRSATRDRPLAPGNTWIPPGALTRTSERDALPSTRWPRFLRGCRSRSTSMFARPRSPSMSTVLRPAVAAAMASPTEMLVFPTPPF